MSVIKNLFRIILLNRENKPEVVMKISFIWALFVALMIIGGCKTDKTPTSPSVDPDPNGEEDLLEVFKESEEAGVVKVMSRNVYIGTDVTDLLDAQSLELIPFSVAIGYQDVLLSNFNQRAEGLVTEIEKTLPHLIGLQEMSKFYIQSPGDVAYGGTDPATDEVLNFLDILKDALAARGLEYTIVATVENADVELPMFVGWDGDTPLLDDILIKDHDVILARGDVIISNSVAVSYDSILVIPVNDETNITISRGYVAVNAQIGQTSVVFTNTHLESIGGGMREAQVRQLLDAYKNESLPVIMVGDFNSGAPTGTTYNVVLDEGYTDTWIMNPLTYNSNGYTYGHDSDVRNESPDLSSRIDFIFASPQGNPTIGEGFVLGDEKRDKTANGLWPSDHAGVVTKLTYAVPGKIASN
jgi:endonuclease/exonuclease/phosphatase family metal-dependent hydrolase